MAHSDLKKGRIWPILASHGEEEAHSSLPGRGKRPPSSGGVLLIREATYHPGYVPPSLPPCICLSTTPRVHPPCYTAQYSACYTAPAQGRPYRANPSSCKCDIPGFGLTVRKGENSLRGGERTLCAEGRELCAKCVSKRPGPRVANILAKKC